MDDTTSGPELRAEREQAGITATALGRAMGYDGTHPHVRVSQIESTVRVTTTMAARYRAALASLRGGKS